VIEYTGEVLSNNVFSQRKSIGLTTGSYAFQLSKGLVLDAERVGNLARFVNHSCEHPNLRAYSYIKGGRYHIYLVTVEHLDAITELSFNYGAHYGNGSIKCECAVGCTKRL
jgi:SET domain-containing protein